MCRLSQLRSGLRRLVRCRSGVAATEFAIFAPMVILGLFTMVDIGSAVTQRMEMDRNVRAGAQAAMSLNNDEASIRGIILASTEEPEKLKVEVNMQCICAGSSASCSASCPDTTAPAVFVEIGAARAHDGILLPERTLRSQTRVQIR